MPLTMVEADWWPGFGGGRVRRCGPWGKRVGTDAGVGATDGWRKAADEKGQRGKGVDEDCDGVVAVL